MTLRLDSRLPLVWRSPFDVQIGVDPPRARIDGVTQGQERMLAALVVGTNPSALAVLAGGREPEASRARDALLELLRPALAVPEARMTVTVAVSGSPSLASAIADQLAGHGIQVLLAADTAELAGTRPDLAVVVGHFVLAPQVHAVWLRRDIPHLPVVVGETAATVGPMVEPGRGPCLLCIELHRRDEDRAWPAIAAQLLGRRSSAETTTLVGETAAAASRMVLARLGSPSGRGAAQSLRIDGATGERQVRVWLAHPECGCGGIPRLTHAGARPSSRIGTAPRPVSPVRPGSGWASAGPIAPAAGSSPS